MKIQHELTYTFKGEERTDTFYSLVGHLKKINVADGALVIGGITEIGESGNTGNPPDGSANYLAHLHSFMRTESIYNPEYLSPLLKSFGNYDNYSFTNDPIHANERYYYDHQRFVENYTRSYQYNNYRRSLLEWLF